MTNLGYIRENPNDEVTQNFDSKIAFRYAYGYFQDEKYVNSNKKILTNEIVPTIKSNYEVLRSRLKLPETFDVIHVRKYPTEGLSFSRIHLGNLSDEYYISWFKGNKPKNLIILCEKKELVSGLLTKIDALQVLTDSDTNAWETLAIMSHARKLLTSNSTLSWWGGRISQEVSNSHVWLPSRWSYWNNVNSSNYHFQGSQTHISDFDLRGYSI
jgi:hypothetical protein